MGRPTRRLQGVRPMRRPARAGGRGSRALGRQDGLRTTLRNRIREPRPPLDSRLPVERSRSQRADSRMADEARDRASGERQSGLSDGIA